MKEKYVLLNLQHRCHTKRLRFKNTLWNEPSIVRWTRSLNICFKHQETEIIFDTSTGLFYENRSTGLPCDCILRAQQNNCHAWEILKWRWFHKYVTSEKAWICLSKQAKIFNDISFTRITVDERIDEITGDLKEWFKDMSSKCEHFSIAIDELIDSIEIAQLAVFIRTYDSEINNSWRTNWIDPPYMILQQVKTCIKRWSPSGGPWFRFEYISMFI